MEGECVQASRGHASAREWDAALVLLIMLLIGTSAHLKDSRKGNGCWEMSVIESFIELSKCLMF